jgi:hypothetical protein
MKRVVAFAIAAMLVACTRAPRGDGCRNDSDCAQDLRCMQTAANTAICTTPCTEGVSESCPKGWKCIELDHLTQSNGCVRE